MKKMLLQIPFFKYYPRIDPQKGPAMSYTMYDKCDFYLVFDIYAFNYLFRSYTCPNSRTRIPSKGFVTLVVLNLFEIST